MTDKVSLAVAEIERVRAANNAVSNFYFFLKLETHSVGLR